MDSKSSSSSRAPTRQRSFVYNLLGPHGIPIEGVWYTGTFRDARSSASSNSGRRSKIDHVPGLRGRRHGDGQADRQYHVATPLRRRREPVLRHLRRARSPADGPGRPLGQQDDRPGAAEEREGPQKSDVGVRISSKPITVGPNQPVVHTYRVFAGPKTAEALLPYGAEELASYHKNQWDPVRARHRPAGDHAHPGLHLRGDRSGRPLLRRQEGKLRHRDHPADDPGARRSCSRSAASRHSWPRRCRAPAPPQGASGEIQGRQGTADQGDLRALQEARGQPGRRLPAGLDPTADLRRALAGAQHQLPAPPRHLLVDSRPRRPGHAVSLSLVEIPVPRQLVQRAAVRGRGLDAGPDQAVRAARHDPRGRDAAEDDEVYDGLHGLDVLQGALGPGHLLHHQQPLGHRRAPALAQGDARDRGVRQRGRRGERPESGASARAAAREVPTATDQARAAARATPATTGPRPKPPGRFAQFWDRVLEEARKDPTYRKVVGRAETTRGTTKDRDRERPRPKPRRR